MANHGQIIKDDRHPACLLDALILSAAVYGRDPKQRLQKMNREYGLPGTAQYEFLSDVELEDAGLFVCKQTLLVVRSLARGHYIIACRGTRDIGDALVDLKIIQRTMSLGDGAAHAGFLDRAKTVPLHFFKKLLIRNEKVVITGHSLGGAVASLLTLRLLEFTGKWCHQQIRCYTFGCPFFADYRLASYINSHYKQHFVHLVSGSDVVPKAMPVVYTLYSLWAGLRVGPLEDVINCLRVFMLGLRAMRMNLNLFQEIHVLGMASEALRWLPTLSRFTLHRVLALALSFHAGHGYAFAGSMMLLDPETSIFELESQEHWTLNTHLQFHLGGVSLDAIKEHRLLSYIKHIFAVNGSEPLPHPPMEQQLSDSLAFTCPPDVIAHTAVFDLQDDSEEQSGQEDGNESQDQQVLLSTTGKEKMKGLRAFRSQVACIIFVKRLQQSVPQNSKSRHKKKDVIGCLKSVTRGISRCSRMVCHYDKIFLGYSALRLICQVHRFICRI